MALVTVCNDLVIINYGFIIVFLHAGSFLVHTRHFHQAITISPVCSFTKPLQGGAILLLIVVDVANKIIASCITIFSCLLVPAYGLAFICLYIFPLLVHSCHH